MKTYTQVNEILETDYQQRTYAEVLLKLKEMGIDGESMQQLIEDVGMTEQMVSQLVKSNQTDALFALMELNELQEGLLSANDELDDYLLSKMTEDHNFYKKVYDLLIKVDTNKFNI